LSWNKGAERLFGYTAEEVIGKPLSLLIPPDRQDEEQVILERIKRDERTDHYETVRQRKNGSLVDVSLRVSPIRTSEGTIIGASKIARDITERKRAQERQTFLIRELQHRTMNLFAVIQSIVDRTLGNSLAKEVLNARLHTLAQAHSLLADAAWEGASLDEVIRRELAAFSAHLSISGCDIVLNAQALEHFALMTHELTTNAVKYGALSTPDGRISVEGSIERENDHGTFSFLWKEAGGPKVSAPKRKGFGSAILHDFAKQFGRRVKMSYDPEGLRYEVSFPLGAIEATASKTVTENHASSRQTQRRDWG
jgi:PAS domain S-box-containing protein